MSDEDGAEAERKYRQRAWANDREKELLEDRRVTDRGEALMRTLRRRRSGKSATPPKRNKGRDAQIVVGIETTLGAGDLARITHLTGPTVTDYRSRERRIRVEEISSTGERTKASTFWTPTWDHAGDSLKQMAWGQVMHANHGCTMTLHIGDDVLAEAQRRNAAAPGAFTAYIRERIGDQLRKAFSRAGRSRPEFFFTIETAYGIPAHVHGALMVSPNDLHIAEAALRRAGGMWKGRQRQVHLGQITNAVGWVRYVTKWREQSRMALQDPRLVAATNGLRSRARAWYEKARRDGTPLG